MRVTQRAPVLLPELKLLASVTLSDDRYHPLSYSTTADLRALDQALRAGGTLFLQQRAGCLPHRDDPKGFRNGRPVPLTGRQNAAVKRNFGISASKSRLQKCPTNGRDLKNSLAVGLYYRSWPIIWIYLHPFFHV